MAQGEPFYIGMGHGDRVKDHFRNSTSHNRQVFSRIEQIKSSGKEPLIQYLAKDIDQELASLIEIEAIALIGRRIKGTGPLWNKHPGGPMVGDIPKKADHIEKIRLAQLTPIKLLTRAVRRMILVDINNEKRAVRRQAAIDKRKATKIIKQAKTKQVADAKRIAKLLPKAFCKHCNHTIFEKAYTKRHGDLCKMKDQKPKRSYTPRKLSSKVDSQEVC